jgi:hypothetical protein
MDRSVADSPRIKRAFDFLSMKFQFLSVNPKYYIATPYF